MNPVRQSLAARRRYARDARFAAYRAAEQSDPLAVQLAQFNDCWKSLASSVPYYANLVEKHQAPERFESWAQFLSVLPVADRPFIYANLPDLCDSTRPADSYRTTGGSTAEPVSLPAWRGETDETESNEWMGRSWYGIDPADACFRLWGHSHLLGKGARGWINARLRETKDALLGIERVSAYDLSDAALLRALERLGRSDAAYMIGYSAALDRFARVVRESGRGNAHPLKAVVATSESFPFPDSRETVEAAFGAPVAMEYGSVETGVLAHTRPGEGYHAFWLSYFIEASEPAPQGGYKVRVTSLYPRAFPLVRYDLGDAILLGEPTVGVRRFNAVLGRSNAFLEFDGGGRVHSEALSHAVKGAGPVSGYQMVQENETFHLRLTVHSPLAPAQVETIRERLQKIHPRLGTAQIEIVEHLEQTRAGKTPLIIRR